MNDKAAFIAGRKCGKTGAVMEWIDEVAPMSMDQIRYILESIFERKPIIIPCDHQPDPALRSTAMPDIHGFIQATEAKCYLAARQKLKGLVGHMRNLEVISGMVSKFLASDPGISEMFGRLKAQTAISKRFPRHEILAGLPVVL